MLSSALQILQQLHLIIVWVFSRIPFFSTFTDPSEPPLMQLDVEVSCIDKTGIVEIGNLIESCLISGFGWSKRKLRMPQGSETLRYFALALLN